MSTQLSKRKKLTKVERLLEKARRNPAPTRKDPRQIDLMDLLREERARRTAFVNLDNVIRSKLGGAR